MMNLEAIRKKLLEAQAERNAVEAEHAAPSDWIKKKVGSEEYFIVPISPDDIWFDRQQLYLEKKLFTPTPKDNKVIVEPLFWKLKNAAGNDKDKTKLARAVEASDVIVLALQNVKTGAVKFHKMKKGYKDHLVGAKLRLEMMGMIEAGDDPTQFKLTITGVDKSLGNGATYVEESFAFARKASKPPAIVGEAPAFDTSYTPPDALKEAIIAYGKSVGLLSD